jgi:hypothetical protein
MIGEAVDKLLYTPNEAAQALGISPYYVISPVIER